MPRQNNSVKQKTDDLSEEFEALDDGEKLIIQDTRTIEKKTVNREKQPPVVVIEDEEEYEPPQIPENSLAALIEYGEDSIENELCTIIIRRNPDELGEKFLTPCRSLTNLPPMRNISLATDRTDIEEFVRGEHGGGHYFFQIHYGGKIGVSWKATLADLKVAIETARQAAQLQTNPAALQPAPAPAPAPVDPMQQMINTLTQQHELKKLLFGDELQELKELREQRQQPPPDQPAPNEKIAMLTYAETVKSEKLQEKIIGSIFDDSKESGVMEAVKFVFENQEAVVSLGSKLLGVVFGSAPPTPQEPAAALESFLKQQPPAPAANPAALQQPAPAPAATSNFKRRKAKPAATDEAAK